MKGVGGLCTAENLEGRPQQYGAKPTTASPRKTTTTKNDAGYWQSSTADEEKQIFRVNTAALRFKPTPLPRSPYLGRAATTKIEANILNKRPNDACTDRCHLCCRTSESVPGQRIRLPNDSHRLN